MTQQQSVIFLAILGGALGGLASFMFIAYDKFKKIPTKSQSRKQVETQRRVLFFILRVTFGVVSSLICSFWFMDNVVNGSLTESRLVFYSAIIGFSATSISDISNAVTSVLTKVMSMVSG